MFTDETIILGENIPKRIFDEIFELEERYSEGDISGYMNCLDIIESDAKSYKMINRITDEDFDLIMKKVRLR